MPPRQWVMCCALFVHAISEDAEACWNWDALLLWPDTSPSSSPTPSLFLPPPTIYWRASFFTTFASTIALTSYAENAQYP